MFFFALQDIGSLVPKEYQFEAEIEVPKTPEQVWNKLVQTDRWKEWVPQIQSVEKVSQNYPEIGSHLQVASFVSDGKKMVDQLEVTERIDQKVFAVRHTKVWIDGKAAPIINGMSRLELGSDQPGWTKITVTGSFQVKGPVNRFLARYMMKPVVDETVSRTVAKIQSHLQKTERKT
ncbi:MAG TPA: SRPBCC family protein [Nitrospiria bacterium]